MTVIHWHGIHQDGTQFMDGVPAITQCPINTINPKTGKLLVPGISATNTINYKFKVPDSGTYFYHGHMNSQHVDGIAGALIVEDTPKITQAYKNYGVTYTAETLLVLTDFYNAEAQSYIPEYLSPASHGDEPIPDALAVNAQPSGVMKINVNKADKLRVRVICGSALSMFRVSVDGMPLTVIETDAEPTQPFDVSYITINTGQRVSFVLDWSKLPKSMSTSPSVVFRVDAIAEMYADYDPTLPNSGIFGTSTHSPLNVHWTGKFVFNELTNTNNNGNPNYNVLTPPSISTPCKPPSDTNLLQALPLFPVKVPPSDLKINYLIQFHDNANGVNLPYINGENFPINDLTPAQLSKPALYTYMSAQGGPLVENNNLPKGSWIPGNGVTVPFVLPYNRTIDMFINNTDGGEHPIHTHGHDFWIIKTSEYTPAQPLYRDTVSVPANGWALIRFNADNPGVWVIHCHISWHIEAGMIAT